MKEKDLHSIKRTGFKVPENYFDTLEDYLVDEIKLKTQTTNQGFKVPDNYFDTLEDSILTQITKTKKTRVISIINKKQLAYLSGIAAAIVILFSITFNNKNTVWSNLDIDTVENYLINENIVDSYEIASLLSDDDIDDFSPVNLEIDSEDLQDFIFENIDLEDIISN
ncbi:hypothetical protein [Gaetbulibacter saemankumensis]|uniref:hypothetical protein n=1 Tax=Gaetbulibacter saemankumensis TaxID=311208 RepID=UPI0003FE4F0C|nr:hypothetical protein [Gaetbulibacter saemankumensis]